MSVRAYRLSDTESVGPSFNCWLDTDIVEFLLKHKSRQRRDTEGAGILKAPVSALKKLLAEYSWNDGKDYRRDAIQADIAAASENGLDTVVYICA